MVSDYMQLDGHEYAQISAMYICIYILTITPVLGIHTPPKNTSAANGFNEMPNIHTQTLHESALKVSSKNFTNYLILCSNLSRVTMTWTTICNYV